MQETNGAYDETDEIINELRSISGVEYAVDVIKRNLEAAIFLSFASIR